MLTVTDFIKLIRHEYHTQSSYESAMEEIRQCTIQQMKGRQLARLLLLTSWSSGRLTRRICHNLATTDIQRANQSRPETLHYLHPMKSVYDCAMSMVKNQVNRMPLVDRDGQNEIVLGLVSQYKVLRFIAANVGRFPSALEQHQDLVNIIGHASSTSHSSMTRAKCE